MEAIDFYESEITGFEKSELSTYDYIYTVGSVRVVNLKSIINRRGDYKIQIGEQIGYRYQVDKVIDAGAFGQVVKCFDMKEGARDCAIKISKTGKHDTDNASLEANLLKKIMGKNPDRWGIVKMYDSFYFRHFFIIVFELLDINLYKYIKQPNFKGMDKGLLRTLATQLLHGLSHLAKINIIHCDLKPENVVFTDKT